MAFIGEYSVQTDGQPEQNQEKCKHKDPEQKWAPIAGPSYTHRHKLPFFHQIAPTVAFLIRLQTFRAGCNNTIGSFDCEECKSGSAKPPHFSETVAKTS